MWTWTLGRSRKEPVGNGKLVHYFQKKRKKQHAYWKQNICSNMHICIWGFSPGLLSRLHHYAILESQLISRVLVNCRLPEHSFSLVVGALIHKAGPVRRYLQRRWQLPIDKCVLSMQVKVCRRHQKKWGLCYMCKLSYVGVTKRNGDTESATSYSNQLFYSPDHALHWLVISYESARNRDTLLSRIGNLVFGLSIQKSIS
jgi:hypothetical protein